MSLKAALAGTEFDLHTAAPDAAARLRETLRALLQRAQRDNEIRGDIDIDDLFALLAGAFATLRHADAEAAPERIARLNTVLFDGLARVGSTTEQFDELVNTCCAPVDP
ncbi:hypothetical protein [Frankia gtarii]|uniref:SbtR family transcriptional regulator n=1 Tax=Frankia gtarii TaxID=2950102 RepID=UPI0021BFC3C1|nr:hypothetical protein [Frankia gtarii]